jgi:heme-degrading monooxygenase HmoA
MVVVDATTLSNAAEQTIEKRAAHAALRDQSRGYIGHPLNRDWERSPKAAS